MSSNFTVVSFTYDLTTEDNLANEFKTVLQGLEWHFQILNTQLPKSTCLKIFDNSVDAGTALKLAKKEIKSIVKKFHEQGYSSFNVERFFLLSHKTSSADAEFGEKLI